MAERQREYDGDLRQLAAMRAFVREACRENWQQHPALEDLIQRLELALTEAASNIILHGEQERQHKSIVLTIGLDDDEASVTLRYRGKPFDPQRAAAPRFDGSQESGFGLHLIRESVDEIAYGQDDEGRCVIRLAVKRKT